MKDPVTPVPIKPDDELVLVTDIESMPSELIEEMSDGKGDDDE